MFEEFKVLGRNIRAEMLFHARHVKKIFRTSWTDDNPGRRFKMCGRYRFPDGCLDFEWVDPFCPRCKAIIPGLRRKIAAREDELVGVNAALASTNVELEKTVREKELIISENFQLVDQLDICEGHLKAKGDELKDMELKMELMEVEWKLKEKMLMKEGNEGMHIMKKMKTAIVVLVCCLLWNMISK